MPNTRNEDQLNVHEYEKIVPIYRTITWTIENERASHNKTVTS